MKILTKKQKEKLKEKLNKAYDILVELHNEHYEMRSYYDEALRKLITPLNDLHK